ncbi:hypothetical protein EON81_10410 [bacterium]|nr:MAG: hypothetical protein EON81_10410 [bacterium]
MAGMGAKTRILQILTDAQAAGRAVAVYSDSEEASGYEVGFVGYIDSGDLTIHALSNRGEPDGKRQYELEEVVRVDIDTSYIRRLELLYEYRDSIFDKEFPKTPAGHQDLRAQLLHAMEIGTLVHLVDSNDVGPTGLVHSVGDDHAEIERISTNGEPDGRTVMLFDDIAKAHIGRRSEQVLGFLYRYHVGLKRLLES